MSEPTVTYSWRIERIDCAPTSDSANEVHRVHWRLFGTDGTNTADLYGDVFLAPADPETFIAYGDLNESTVISWLEAAIDASAGDENPTVAQMRAGLAGILAAKGAELLPTPKPWEVTEIP
jgi:hypothetical protein